MAGSSAANSATFCIGFRCNAHPEIMRPVPTNGKTRISFWATKQHGGASPLNKSGIANPGMSAKIPPDVRHCFPRNQKLIARFLPADPRPWLVGFSGGKDSTLVASLIFDAASCRSRLGSMK
jgi:hypothetical protein